MGFLDKVQQTLDKGKEKLEDVKADREADKLLLDLGKWYYAGRVKGNAEAAAHVERLVGELQAHEAEHGELGAAAAEAAAPAAEAPAADAGPAPAPPPVDAPGAPPVANDPPPIPPSGASPVTQGPPPPPE